MNSILDYLEEMSEINSAKKAEIYAALRNPTKASIENKEKNGTELKGMFKFLIF